MPPTRSSSRGGGCSGRALVAGVGLLVAGGAYTQSSIFSAMGAGGAFTVRPGAIGGGSGARVLSAEAELLALRHNYTTLRRAHDELLEQLVMLPSSPAAGGAGGAGGAGMGASDVVDATSTSAQ